MTVHQIPTTNQNDKALEILRRRLDRSSYDSLASVVHDGMALNKAFLALKELGHDDKSAEATLVHLWMRGVQIVSRDQAASEPREVKTADPDHDVEAWVYE